MTLLFGVRSFRVSIFIPTLFVIQVIRSTWVALVLGITSFMVLILLELEYVGELAMASLLNFDMIIGGVFELWPPSY